MAAWIDGVLESVFVAVEGVTDGLYVDRATVRGHVLEEFERSVPRGIEMPLAPWAEKAFGWVVQ